MIKFACKNCGQHIKVSDQYAGKTSKCPKCKCSIVVPMAAQASAEQADIIKFRCPHCSQKIGLARDYAGKQVKCAKCKQSLTVPQATTGAATNATDETTALGAGIETTAHVGIWDQLGDMDELMAAEQSAPALEFAPSPPPVPDEPVIIRGTSEEEAEPTGKRELPWPIDIFLYPTSFSGIITVGIIVAGQLLAPFFCCISSIIQIVFGLYMYWFFCECVRDSAGGGIRAPETIGSMESLAEMFWQSLRLFAFYCFFFGTVTFYF